MTVPTPPAVPVPNPPPTPWIVEPSTERVELRGNTAEVTFTVKNQQATVQRAVFEVVPGDSVAATWFAIEGERQRPIEANQSTQFKVTITAPAGTPVASYWFQTRVYAADVAPEESSTLSNRVTFSVPTDTVAPKKSFPWWIIAVVVAVLLVLGVVAFLVTRDGGGGPAVIPGVTGKVSAEAVQELNDAGFDNVKVVRVQSTEIDAGLALGTDPSSGSTIETDTEVVLRVAVDLGAPTLIAPGDNTNLDASTTKVPLVWTEVPDAASYRVQVTAPACSVTVPTSAAPQTTVAPPPPPPPPSTMVAPDVTIERTPFTVFLDESVLTLQVCSFRRLKTLTTTDIPVDGTTFELTIDTNGDSTAVVWSVSALDDQGNAGPPSTARQFAQVP